MFILSFQSCTVFSSSDLCNKILAKELFTTPVGTPGQAASPVVRLVNSSVVEVEWGTEFQVRNIVAV